MPNFKQQFILFSVASAGYGIAFFGSLLMKDAAIHILVRFIGFSGFGISALLAYKKHRSSKLAA